MILVTLLCYYNLTKRFSKHTSGFFKSLFLTVIHVFESLAMAFNKIQIKKSFNLTRNLNILSTK
jgi:hypothetical protein